MLEEARRNRARCDEERRVIVRIWSSEYDDGKDVGHVSIETFHPKGYMSLWPIQAIPLPSLSKEQLKKTIATVGLIFHDLKNANLLPPSMAIG